MICTFKVWNVLLYAAVSYICCSQKYCLALDMLQDMLPLASLASLQQNMIAILRRPLIWLLAQVVRLPTACF